LKMPAFEWVHVQLHQQKGMISLSPPTICNSALARRFGLLGYEAATLEDVGREIGLTRERVRQIQVEGLRRLREILQGQGLNIEALFRE
ncbi:sigma factor-like helix-turn-helix DNA-binding protein, partial [Enterobacter hormaechei]